MGLSFPAVLPGLIQILNDDEFPAVDLIFHIYRQVAKPLNFTHQKLNRLRLCIFMENQIEESHHKKRGSHFLHDCLVSGEDVETRHGMSLLFPGFYLKILDFCHGNKSILVAKVVQHVINYGNSIFLGINLGHHLLGVCFPVYHHVEF